MATLNTLEERIQTLSSTLSTQTNQLNLRLADCEDDITEINTRIASLSREDIELHQEIHDVANTVDNNTSRIEQIENKDYQGQLDTLNSTLLSGDNSLQSQLDEMDEEHHEELHLLANSIDVHTTQINNIALEQAAIPEHVILSIDEYEALGLPETDKIYFAYEE